MLRTKYEVTNETNVPLRIVYQIPIIEWNWIKDKVLLQDTSVVLGQKDKKILYTENRLGVISRPMLYCDRINHIAVYSGDSLLISTDTKCEYRWKWFIKEKYVSGGGELIYLLTIDTTKLKR
jgi:hypothetical protein